MKKSDYLFYFLIGSSFVYVAYFVYLISNMNFWLWDLKNCFSMMEFKDFLINHIHIFFYLFSTPIVSFFLLKTVFKGFKNLRQYLLLKNFIQTQKKREFKNIIIIPSNRYIAFNFGILKRRIVLSTKVLSLAKEEKKYIFSHEKAHFIHKDSLKFFIFSILSEMFPFSKKLKKDFVLLKEIEADKQVKKDKAKYAQVLLNFYQSKLETDIPLAGGFLKDRFFFLLEEKEPKISLYIVVPIGFVFIAILSFVLKNCFCGVM